jgi:uncharacterized protein (DUF2236 family)
MRVLASPVPGPQTITWRRASDARVMIAAGYALLLQVAHPTVGAGVSEHSRFQRDPWGRLLRTLDYTCTIVYGGPHAAGAMGQRIRSFHTHIKGVRPDGQRYHALEPAAYAWVHATLADAIVLAHELFGRPFSQTQREELWAQWRSLAPLLGIREPDLPVGWTAFREYFNAMVDRELEHTPAVEEVLALLARPTPPQLSALLRPAWPVARFQLGHFLKLATVGLLPPQLRERFGLSWTTAHALELRALSRGLRAATPLMPPSLRNTGPGYLRWRRREIEAMLGSSVAITPRRASGAGRRRETPSNF